MKDKKELGRLIIDELNTATTMLDKSLYEIKLKKKLSERVKKILTSNEDFEKLINFKLVYNFNNEKLLG